MKIAYLLFAALTLNFAASADAQNLHVNPDRGAKLGNSYSIGDFETINTTNGNLMLKFRFGSLPPGRGSADSAVYLTYNSKLYNMRTEKLPDYRHFDAYYNRTVIEPDLMKGGWQLSSGYRLEFESRFRTPEPNCTAQHSELNDQIVYSNKLKVVFPDGSSHEMIPAGHRDLLGDRFFNVMIDGMVRSCYSMPTYVPRPVYYSRDGSFLRLETTSETAWTLHFPDGSRVVNGSQIYDRNGNFVTNTGLSVSDQFGRNVAVTWDSNGDTLVTSKGFNGENVVWRIKGKTIAVRKTYVACEIPAQCPADEFPLSDHRDRLYANHAVVDRIVQPSQLGGGEYVFSYNAPDYDPNNPAQQTFGWGEISKVQLPTGSELEYAYLMDGEDAPHALATRDILKNYPTSKTLKYDLEQGGQVVPGGAVETWSYDITSTGSFVTDPSGGVTKTFFGSTEPLSSGIVPWNSGLTLQTVFPDGSKVENVWERNVPTACGTSSTCPSGAYGDHADNPYIKTEFKSITDAQGNYTLTSIRDFRYDKNGNVTEVKEYDWMPYSAVPRSGTGAAAFPTGVPDGAAAYLKRILTTEFYNSTPDASSTNYTDPDGYHSTTSKRLLRLVRSSAVLDAAGVVKSRTEFSYDYTNYDTLNSVAGNPTVTRFWDSGKGTATDPLTDDNSVKTQTTYNQYGMPLTTTDANGAVTQITYGAVQGPNGAVFDLYPTQTVQAAGTSVARTSTAAYDFHTGLVTAAADADNNVSTVTEYDALGRPTKVRSAAGTPLESRVRTEYSDAERRVIVRSDLETLGDGRKVAIQHYDQLGRVRLSRTLENAATEDPYDETHGIKVETRYQTGNPNSYQLTSNPFRAATAAAAGSEPTMGWTRSKAWNHGRRSEVETFSGAVPPAPWGSNTASTGAVVTETDADRTLVTDQAGKKRLSRADALGHLKDVWEIAAQEAGVTEAVTFPGYTGLHAYRTGYGYDALNNLTAVNQGAQTRSFTYSSLSRLLSATNPESGTISYQYDPNGNLTRKTDARGVRADYVYDALDRVTQRNYSTPGGTPPNYQATPNVTYTYDDLPNARGRLTKVQSSVSTTEYTAFDILGRVTAHKQTTDGQAYTTAYGYNLSGAVIEQTYPSGRVVRNTLDSDGSLSQVQSAKPGQTLRNYANGFIYNAAGAVTQMRLGNGLWETTQFNSRLQPTQIALGTGPAAQNKLKLDYSYGTAANNGNVLSQTITVPTVGANQGFTAVQNYTYDALNRLKSAAETIGGNQTWKQTFTFDRYGNRRFDLTGGNTTTLDPQCPEVVCNPQADPATNKLVGYGFDGSGNTTQDAEGRTFVYDGENKQVEVKDATNATIGQYFYDGDGKRIKKVVPATGETTIFVYDAAGKQIAEYSTIVQTGPNAKTVYTTNDHLGSPRINTDATGQVVSRHDYHPFGEEIATPQRTSSLGYTAVTIRKQFTGYERDNETDLDYAQARMYGNSHGRFTSPDPTLLSVNAYNPQSWNRYIYVLNNPYLYTDPLGLWEITTETVCKKNDDGTCKTYRNGEVKVDKVIVTARKTKDDDDGASLAKQLGLTGRDATRFAERIGDSNNVRLADQGGLVGRVFSEVESGLAQQANWRNENKERLTDLAARRKYGPGDNDCSGTTCRIGLGDNVPLIGTNVLDPRLDVETRNVAESEARVGDIIRYAKENNVATHFANFIFRNDDGTPIAFSKSGTNGPYEIRSAASLQSPITDYGTIRGRTSGQSGYYRRR